MRRPGYLRSCNKNPSQLGFLPPDYVAIVPADLAPEFIQRYSDPKYQKRGAYDDVYRASERSRGLYSAVPLPWFLW